MDKPNKRVRPILKAEPQIPDPSVNDDSRSALQATARNYKLVLADQLIAAKLNIANGVDGTPVTSTIAAADAVLSLYPGKLPYGVRTNSTNGRRMVNAAATLESYNEGALTPGCGG